MRGPSSDHGGRGEKRCCISSDAEGRILTTSFPPIQHPLSIRPVPESFYHLERFDSEHTGTAIAQVGQAISLVPPSQRMENAMWHKWLGQASSPVSSQVAIEGSRVSLEYKVSPGVSEIRRPKQKLPPSSPPMSGFIPSDLNQASLGESQDLNKAPNSSNSSEIMDRYEELLARLRRLELEIQGQNSLATSSVEIRRLEHISTDCSSSQPPVAAQQADATSEGTDPDEAWKTFVFGDEGSDEVGRAAFEEAKHDAARSLRPSDPPYSSDEGFECVNHSNIATAGTRHTDHGNETSESAEGPPSTEASASVKATYGPSSSGVVSDPTVDISESVQAPGVEVSAGTSSVPGAESAADTSESRGPGSVEESGSSALESHKGALSMTTSMAVAPARSEVEPSETGITGEQFRFTQPKLFVGSRSNPSQPIRVVGPGVGITLAKKRRGRPKKRANDGRADIRALPNYSSDPIEEFEEEKRTFKEGRVPKSRFPALELT
ncbi:hypothetical protein C8A00DRAFT_18641 [Chaetomidium leptoderma]|uniref:Uncharacterized protein n=1 Tax=Chaetomidium leptoderma TaxID=669021 RepID=A0AAN6VFS4_9PEZI|nr:hypothetical protein C8A00DRAFT_18641 [Chaetomidium leptoderma]